MKPTALVALFLICALPLISQPPADPLRKQTEAIRISSQPKMDGILDDPVWMEANPANDFTQFQPNPGQPASQQTEVRILYDNNALYVGVHLFDTAPDSILQEMTERDELGNTDYFGLILDAYRDGINGLGFIVTPAGIQFDTKFSALNENGGGSIQSGDTNWDAVWVSETHIDAAGWSVEMRIPYSAIRFPETEEQVWNINFVRSIRRTREEVFWHPVDPNGARLISQAGQIRGIRDVKAPLRLSATPFLTTYATHYKYLADGETGAWGKSIGGGMDIKYGINDAFTLDMTLIPDFGETISDNQILNLSPFEVQFDENRQFFTEGVELFNKGNFFYSRRVGGTPLKYGDIDDGVGLMENEVVENNPISTSLINATKVSGRTTGGLGVGVFNAIASQTNATILNQETGVTRLEETNPLTNYNVLVFDQNLRNNSFFSLINTNVLRAGGAYDANVTGTVFDLRNKVNSYSINGKAAVSQLYNTESTDLGFTYNLNFQKTSGQLQYGVFYNVESDDYDPNDLGFLFNNNERSLGLNLSYNRFKPFGKFNSGGWGIYPYYSRLYSPNVYADFGVSVDAWLKTKKFFAFGVFTYLEPFQTYDYFEPRVSGRYYAYPTNKNFGGWISTDYRKKLALDIYTNYRKFDEPGRVRVNIDIQPRFRVNDRLSFRLSVGSYNFLNDIGWVETLENETGEVEAIYFGRRDLLQVETGLTANFNFTNRMNLNIRVRHYWSAARYNRFNELAEDGTLLPTEYDSFNDRNFTAFNIDAVYRWRFAPGSDLFFIYKNAILDFIDSDPAASYRYWDSLGNMALYETTNTFNLKIIYYLDYQQFVSPD